MGPETRRRLFYYVVIFCGEFIATAFLMIFGCMGMDEKVMNPTHSALAWGFTVTALITAFGHLTHCHINPCVTTCLLILGLVESFAAVIYLIAQFLGAIGGFYIVLILTRNHLLNVATNPEAKFCLTIIEDGVPVSHGVLCEFLATSLLTFAVCSATDRRNAIWRDSIAIKLGITIGALVYGIGQYTGASMNPARSFAPALLYMKWKNHWVYWVSTLGGAIFTSVLYRILFSPSVEDEIVINVVKQSVSDMQKQKALVVDDYNPKSGSKIELSNLPPELKTEMAIQKDTGFTSNK